MITKNNSANYIFVFSQRDYKRKYKEKIKEINNFLNTIKENSEKLSEINDFINNKTYKKQYLINISNKLKSLVKKIDGINKEYIGWINKFEWIVKSERVQVITYKRWWAMEKE